jgi:DNA polymerase-4
MGETQPDRWILHADLDAFYASVEQLDDPTLRGQPVVVGGRPEQRGVVAAASYEARAFGVHSAMPMREALRRCPKAVVRPPRFPRYSELSQAVFARYRTVTPLVEPISLDEAYLDVTEVAANEASAAETGRRLKAEIRMDLGLVVSIGVSTAKVVSKIASDLDKPDGFLVVPAGGESAFLAPLPVERLWGVGPKVAERLHAMGVRTIGDLAEVAPEHLQTQFGKTGGMLAHLSRGIDSRAVQPERHVKSVSRETTFARDVRDQRELDGELQRLAESVSRRLEGRGLAGRTVVVKLRYADFRTVSRQSSLPAPVSDRRSIVQTARPLLSALLRDGSPVRLLGVGVAGFTNEGYQLPLFGPITSSAPSPENRFML